METVIVERRFEEEVTKEMLDALAEGAASCLELHNVTWKASYIARDRKSMLCFYEAPDAESVRQSQKLAGFPVSRVYMADGYTPPSQ